MFVDKLQVRVLLAGHGLRGSGGREVGVKQGVCVRVFVYVRGVNFPGNLWLVLWLAILAGKLVEVEIVVKC